MNRLVIGFVAIVTFLCCGSSTAYRGTPRPTRTPTPIPPTPTAIAVDMSDPQVGYRQLFEQIAASYSGMIRFFEFRVLSSGKFHIDVEVDLPTTTSKSQMRGLAWAALRQAYYYPETGLITLRSYIWEAEGQYPPKCDCGVGLGWKSLPELNWDDDIDTFTSKLRCLWRYQDQHGEDVELTAFFNEPACR